VYDSKQINVVRNAFNHFKIITSIMDRFEYKILNVSREYLKRENFQSELMDTLNNLGGDGWELINAEGLNEGSIFWKVSETVDILFFFKRKRD
jgi:hypothetical protein